MGNVDVVDLVLSKKSRVYERSTNRNDVFLDIGFCSAFQYYHTENNSACSDSFFGRTAVCSPTNSKPKDRK